MSTAPLHARPRASVWLKRIVISLLVLANVGVFLVYWGLRRIDETVASTVKTVPDAVPALTPTLPDSVDPITFLLVGSDSREGLDSLDGFGSAGGQRSDVVMLVKIHPDESSAQILSIPRDLWVEIPGEGEAKINAAYASGGAPLLIETVRDFTAIDINHYVEIDFAGFQSIVDQIGGVEMTFEHAARDAKSGLAVEAGVQTLDGAQALAYARSRSYQELQGGSWVSVDADDFGRTARQQEVIIAILDRIARPSSLTEAAEIVGSLTEHVSMDAALAESSMVELAFRMRGLRPDAIERATLPGTTGSAGGQSVVFPEEPAASEMLAAFRRGSRLVDEGEDEEAPLSVVVLNGNGVEGSAARWSDILADSGFDVAHVGDVDDGLDHRSTLVTVREGDEEEGERIVLALGFGSVDTGTVPSGTDAVVVLGSDAEGVSG